MWGGGVIQSPGDEDRLRNPWHNEAEQPREEVVDPSTLNRESTTSSDSGEASNHSGTWGERDVGMSQRVAMEDFEALRQTLTSLSKSRSHPPSER